MIVAASAGLKLVKGISALTEMPFYSLKRNLQRACGVLLYPPDNLLQVSITIIMKRFVHLKVSLDLEFDAPQLVRVKAHTRICNGKVVKVRSYYRRVEGRTVGDRRTV